jgi:carbonic anhydrase
LAPSTDGAIVAKDKGKGKKDKGDDEPSNLVPAVIIAIGFVLFGKFAGASGGAAAPAVANTPAAEATAEKTVDHAGDSAKTSESTETSESMTPSAHPSKTDAPHESTAPTTPAAPHWAYEGDTGPNKWGSLSADYAACVDGTKQSPIDIKDPVKVGLTDIGFSYTTMGGTVTDNGHALVVKFEPGSSITVDGTRFDLLQMHWHTPSEHTFDGKDHAGELHLVHADAAGNLAVVGLLIDEGDADNARLEPVTKSLPAGGKNDLPTAGPLELALMLPDDRSAVRYQGSLTTPPCSETVNWMVVTKPITMSKAQLEAIKALHDGNNRPPQPTNARPVLLDSGPDK